MPKIDDESKRIEGQIVAEAVGSLRTVSALQLQPFVEGLYAAALPAPTRRKVRSTTKLYLHTCYIRGGLWLATGSSILPLQLPLPLLIFVLVALLFASNNEPTNHPIEDPQRLRDERQRGLRTRHRQPQLRRHLHRRRGAAQSRSALRGGYARHGLRAHHLRARRKCCAKSKRTCDYYFCAAHLALLLRLFRCALRSFLPSFLPSFIRGLAKMRLLLLICVSLFVNAGAVITVL